MTAPRRRRAASRRLGAAVALAVLAPLGTAAVALAPPADAAASAPTVNVTGHGWGHGRGMGQWGALGYATNQGWSHDRILDHFYGGTRAGAVPNSEVSVRLTALDGANRVVITSGADFVVDSARISGGDAAVLTRSGDRWSLTGRRGGCEGTDVSATVDVGRIPTVAPTAAPAGDRSKMLTVCGVNRPYRGALRPTVDPDGASHLVNLVRVEDYLRGVVPRESPPSWADAGGGRGAAALRAQAVAARSYGLSERRTTWATTCDTTSCQVYGGAASEDPRTDAAIAATTGQVRTTSTGAVVRTEFSASTGGWSAGGQFPAVPDEGDVVAPRHDWTLAVPTSRISAAFPAIGEYRSLTVLARNGLGADGGRVTRVRVDGTRGQVTTTGAGVRAALGLWSDWFTITGTSGPSGPAPSMPPAPSTPPGSSTPPAAPAAPRTQWMLRTTPTAGAPELLARYGDDASTKLACDADGDGRDGLTVYRGNTWYVRNAATPGTADTTFSFGAPGWTPVCGDWDGDGKDGIGAYDPSTGTWWLRSTATPGPAEVRFQYGWSAAAPVVGDWDRDGSDDVGVYDRTAGTWLLRLSPSGGRPELRVQYGYPGATPVAGDWDGDGRTTLGVYDAGRWLLRDSLLPGAPDRVIGYGGPGFVPIPGTWGADAITGVGVGAPRP